MRNHLARDAISAMAWSYVGVAAYVLLQVGSNIAYARILGPDQFGLFAAGLLAIGILRQISDLGLGSALTQARSLGPTDVRAAFGRLIVAGVAAFLLLLFSSHSLALLFSDPRLEKVFRCFAAALLCFPFSIICAALLARELDQKHSQLANVLGYGIGYCAIGLTAALLGMGAWSPIVGFFAQLLINTLVLYTFSKADLRPLFARRTRDDGGIPLYGLKVMLTNLSNWFIYSMDNLLVQFFFGTRHFGIYTLAYGLVRTPADHMVQTLQNVLLPASSRLSDDRERLGRAYLTALEAVMLVLLPVFSSVAVLSTTMIDALYGSRWSGAQIVLAPLALAMPLQAVSTVSSAMLWGSGLVGKELRVQWVAAPILLSAIVIGAQISFAAVAWSVFLAYLIRAALMVRAFSLFAGLPFARNAKVCGGGFVLALIIAPTLWMLDAWLRQRRSSPLMNLTEDFALALAMWIGLVVMGRKLLLSRGLSGLVTMAWNQLLPKLVPRSKNVPG